MRPMRLGMLDAKEVARVDRHGMRGIIAALPDQLEASAKLGLGSAVDLGEAQRVFIVGMGGSAIAGDVEDVLVAVSYSGNTEETLSATTQGMKLGCRMVAITSGGALRDLARKANAPVFEVPPGLPPRGAFGHLFGVLPAIAESWVFGHLHAEVERAIAHLRQVREKLRPEVGARANRAKSIAVRLRSTVPVLYAMPPGHTPIIFRDRDEPPEMRRQLDITVELISRHASVLEVETEGETTLSRLLGTLFLGDYVSLYLATLHRVDPLPLAPIEELKKRLARSRRKS